MMLNARQAAAHPAFGPAQFWRLLALAVLLICALLPRAHAQDKPFKDEELDQMLAPIALYPDSLLAQVLMASTYPADFAEAVAWSKAHPDEKGDAGIAKVESMAWDPSVKSLVGFPQVLAMMGAKPEHVQRLGDAFLADPGRVMDRVQVLRKKAQEAGNLKSNEQQKVSATTEANKQVIIIEPAKPDVVYVPAYEPTVYGAWGYPAYPPYYYPPPPYYYPPGGAFVAGVFWGAAIVGIANGNWGGCNWGGGNVNINVNKYNNVNVNNKVSNNNFNHNPERRGDVPYRDSKSQSQYGAKQREGAKDREAYRGKDGRDADRSKAESTMKDRGVDPAAGRDKASAGASNTGRSSAGASGSSDRGAGASTSQRSSAGSSMGGSSGALSGVQNSSASRESASRGQSSSASMHSGGGGARAGGGGGGGGGRRR